MAHPLVPFFGLALLLLHSALVTSVDGIMESEKNVDNVLRSFTATGEPLVLNLPKPSLATTPLAPPQRLLMGPGPSTPHPRVLAATSLPLLGHVLTSSFSLPDFCQQASIQAYASIPGYPHHACINV
eukprot:jgi/Mesen1/9563/ME000644S08863